MPPWHCCDTQRLQQQQQQHQQQLLLLLPRSYMRLSLCVFVRVAGDQIVIANNSIVLGLPVERCLASLRARQRPGLLQQQERQQLLPLQLEVYRGSFPVLYGAPALAALQRLGAVKELLSSNSSAEQQYRQQQQTPPVHTPAGSLNSLLQGADTRHSEFF